MASDMLVKIDFVKKDDIIQKKFFFFPKKSLLRS